MSKIQARLGKRIREIRKERSLTIARLAEATNLSANFIGSIERGVRAPAIDTLERIARALKVKVEDLFHFPSEEEGEKKKALEELIHRLKGKDIRDIELVSRIAETLSVYSGNHVRSPREKRGIRPRKGRITSNGVKKKR